MAKGRCKSKNKKIRPKYWVFCEGESEDAYVSFLRSKYRSPTVIVSKVTGDGIKESYISHCKKDNGGSHPKDKTFLLYDGDVQDVLNNVERIKNADMLITTPCIEYWFLLHYGECKSIMTSASCLRKFKGVNPEYKKGYLNKSLNKFLDDKVEKACERAKQTVVLENPSSNIYEFVEELKKAKSKLLINTA
jgi:hypothetical protein